MAKQTPRPVARASATARTSHTGVDAHQEHVQQHDRLDHRPAGQRDRLGDVQRCRRIIRGAGRARRLPRSLAAEKAARAAQEHGLRRAESAGQGSRLGPRRRRSVSIQQTGIEVVSIKDVHPCSPQWLPARPSAGAAEQERSLRQWLVTPDPRCASRAVRQRQHLREREGPQPLLERRPFPPGAARAHPPPWERRLRVPRPDCRRSRRRSTSTASSSVSSRRPTRKRSKPARGPPVRILLRLLGAVASTTSSIRAGWASTRPAGTPVREPRTRSRSKGKRVDIASYTARQARARSMSLSAEGC